MILVFGGAFNGKLGFVKEEFEVSEEDIFYCNEDKINFSKKVICGLHKFTYFNVTKEKSSIEFIKNNIKLFKNKIIICIVFLYLYVNQDLNNFKILKISNSFYLKLNI